MELDGGHGTEIKVGASLGGGGQTAGEGCQWWPHHYVSFHQRMKHEMEGAVVRPPALNLLKIKANDRKGSQGLQPEPGTLPQAANSAEGKTMSLLYNMPLRLDDDGAARRKTMKE